MHEYVNRLHFNYRDHRKIACIDGDVAYTSGVNIADEYANIIERFGYWKDSGVCLEGEGAWGLTASFIRMCVNLGGVMHNEHDYYRPHTPVKSEGFCQPFTDGPQNNPDNPAEDVFLQMISGARRFLYITTPYFIPGKEPDACIVHRGRRRGRGRAADAAGQALTTGTPTAWRSHYFWRAHQTRRKDIPLYPWLSARKKHHGRPRSSLCWLGEYGLPQL